VKLDVVKYWTEVLGTLVIPKSMKSIPKRTESRSRGSRAKLELVGQLVEVLDENLVVLVGHTAQLAEVTQPGLDQMHGWRHRPPWR
jgi:hypothetical protein